MTSLKLHLNLPTNNNRTNENTSEKKNGNSCNCGN